MSTKKIEFKAVLFSFIKIFFFHVEYRYFQMLFLTLFTKWVENAQSFVKNTQSLKNILF